MVNADEEKKWAYLLAPTFQCLNTSGKPLTEGWIEVYIHGTRNKYYCASDFSGTLHPFKIPLDSLGANIILASPLHSYDVYVYNKFGSLSMSRYNIVPATNVGEAGGTEYTAGDAIDITNDTISVKYGKCLGLDSNGNIEVNVGDGLEYDTYSNAIIINKDEINDYVDKSLFIINPDRITDWIDITNEFEFINGFRAHYDVPDIIQFKPMYSPSTNLLKFFGEMRINRTNSIPTGSTWTNMIRYVGNRFYNNMTAPTLDARPLLYPSAPIGNMIYTPVTNSEGVTQIGLAKITWIGSRDSDVNGEGIAMQILFANNAVYGTMLTNLIYKVTPINQ